MPKLSNKQVNEALITMKLMDLVGGYMQMKMPQLGYGLINYNTPEAMAEQVSKQGKPRKASERIPPVPPNLNQGRFSSMPVPGHPQLSQSNILHQEYGPNELDNPGRQSEPYLSQSESVSHDIYPTPQDRHPEVFTGDYPVSQSQFLGPIKMTKGRSKMDKRIIVEEPLMTRFVHRGNGDNRLPGLPPDRRSQVSREGQESIYVPYANPNEIHDHFKRLIEEEAKKLGEPSEYEKELATKFMRQEKDRLRQFKSREDQKAYEERVLAMPVYNRLGQQVNYENFPGSESFQTGQYLQGVPFLHKKGEPTSNLKRHEQAVRSGRAPRSLYPRPNLRDKALYFLDEDERERAESQRYNSEVQPLDRSYQYDINGPLPNYVPYQPTHGPGNVVKSLNAVALRNSKGFKRISTQAEKKARVALEKKLGQKFKEDKAFRNPENYPSSKALKGYKRKKRVPDITDEALRFLDEDEREKMEGRGRRKRAYRKK
jgi:hypothetical protein